MIGGFEFRCPACGSQAVYRYGRARTGKQRFICMMCRRQFTPESKRIEIMDRPVCPKCGKLMHLYKRNCKLLTFRCSSYPQCKTYEKKSIE